MNRLSVRPCASRDIALDIIAQVPFGQTLDQVTMAEYGFDPQRDVWKLLQRGTPASVATGSYRWTLKPGAGVRYLQVWAADSAGMTSSYPYQTFINLIPGTVEVEHGHTDVYRFALNAEEQFTVQVAILHGDADLYVWGPSGDSSMRWVSNGRGSQEQVSFTTPVNGVYQVEVRGHSDAKYRLTVTHNASASLVLDAVAMAAATSAPVIADAKEIPEAPAISLDSTPAFSAPSDTIVYLPLVIR